MTKISTKFSVQSSLAQTAVVLNRLRALAKTEQSQRVLTEWDAVVLVERPQVCSLPFCRKRTVRLERNTGYDRKGRRLAH